MKRALITTAFAGMAAALTASPANAWLGSDYAMQIPAGYCIADVSVRGSHANNVSHRWDAKDAAGVRIGYPLMHWDAMDGRDTSGGQFKGYYSLSVKIDKIASGNCLADVAYEIGGRGEVVRPADVIGAPNWESRGFWWISGAWTQAKGGIFDRPIAALYTREMTQDSPRIVTGLTAQYRGNCSTPTAGLPAGSQVTCLGSFRGEGGKGNDFIALTVTTMPYVKPASPVLASVTGFWSVVSTCHGCASTRYQIQVGTSSGQSISKETETSRQLSVTLGAEITLGSGTPTEAKSSLSITGTIGSAQRDAVVNSFDRSVETQQEVTCDKGALWQWTSEVKFTGGAVSRAKSLLYVCTMPTAKSPATSDISWTG